MWKSAIVKWEYRPKLGLSDGSCHSQEHEQDNMGCIHKSRYREDGEKADRHAIRLKIANKLATLVIATELTMYSQ